MKFKILLKIGVGNIIFEQVMPTLGYTYASGTSNSKKIPSLCRQRGREQGDI
jgi:hypothetical protein